MKALAALAALACALIAGPALAQTQPPPCVPQISTYASCPPTQPGSVFVAPAGGGFGTGAAVAEDMGLPSSSVGYPVTLAPTLTASSPYSTGNVLGGLLVLTGSLRETVPGKLGRAILQRVVLDFKSAQTAQTDVLLFSTNPTNSTFTDKTALSLSTLDFASLIGVVHISDCTNVGTPSLCQASGLAIPVWNLTDSKIYAVAVTRGTPTFTAATDLSISFSFFQ